MVGLFNRIAAWYFARLSPDAIMLTTAWLLWVPVLFMGVPTGEV